MITAPFSGVWGFPWHGKCKGGEIDGYAKTFNQPPNGNAWLIDMGLPSISLTTEEAAEATANDYKWRNYALISGGQVYDTALPKDSFIHVDADNKCWLITLSYSYPTTNTIRISASIKRFGMFGFGESSSITKTVDVVCEEIDSSLRVNIEDVWTNGEKLLIGLRTNGTFSDLVSVIELLITGSGGADGTGLSISASEIREKSVLTYSTGSDGAWADLAGGANSIMGSFNVGVAWEFTEYDAAACAEDPNNIAHYWLPSANLNSPSFWFPVSPTGYGGGYDIYLNRDLVSSFAASAYYNQAGAAKTSRLELRDFYDHTFSGGSEQTIAGYTFIRCNNQTEISAGLSIVWSVSVTGYKSIGIYLYEDSTLIDKLEWRQEYAGTQTHIQTQRVVLSDYFETTYSTTGTTWTGSLAANYDPAEVFDEDTNLISQWRSKAGQSASGTWPMTDGEEIGAAHIDAKSMALFHPTETQKEWGTIRTPLGNKTHANTALSVKLYFAWQRKTGDFEFDDEPICYV